ncbi:hypothetical protein F7725_001579 [Dissostichus mawsoni]|uniref:Uncharacterized protein n=1 Tax=Dissostichus mawsoni TaxID=36200 RepID=A0A7J5Y066_DISMA|nr:hypothetical protein F7725_001579 [Dissostichus mawsoni]
MNSEEIYSSLRGVTEAIQSFSYRSQEDLNEPIRQEGKRDDAAGREGVASSPGSDARLGLDVVEGGRTALDNKTSLLNTPSPRSFSGPRGRTSNHNERSEERKGALVELLKITREDNLAVWDEHFKTILLLLLETLGDKDVVRAAEEAASTLAGSIHPEQCIKVLCPIVQTADYPINLAAIKMQTKGYDNTESSVRKASVFCLVAIYSVIGEDLKPHLALLTGSKVTTVPYTRTHTQPF